MSELTSFERELLARFSASLIGGEVWVRYEDALGAVDLAQERRLRLLGLEGFIVGESGVFPSMSRISDFSSRQGTAYDDARTLLMGPWVDLPDDVHSEAEGIYMIDVVVEDWPRHDE